MKWLRSKCLPVLDTQVGYRKNGQRRTYQSRSKLPTWLQAYFAASKLDTCNRQCCFCSRFANGARWQLSSGQAGDGTRLRWRFDSGNPAIAGRCRDNARPGRSRWCRPSPPLTEARWKWARDDLVGQGGMMSPHLVAFLLAGLQYITSRMCIRKPDFLAMSI